MVCPCHLVNDDANLLVCRMGGMRSVFLFVEEEQKKGRKEERN